MLLQVITTHAAVNAFHSQLALFAGSDRSLSICDMNRASVVKTYAHAQKKPIHRIVINQGSSFIAHQQGCFCLFAFAHVSHSTCSLFLLILIHKSASLFFSLAHMQADFYNTFFTAAIGDGVSMWDVRAPGCVRRFTGNISRACPVGVDVSPCGRFLAAGSEDRAAYIFDVGSGQLVQRLTGHTDMVTDVAFSPVKPYLATTSQDGQIRQFHS